VPVLDYLRIYKREIAAFFANSTAASGAIDPVASGPPKHYVRASQPVNPETLAAYRSRLASSRSNAYLVPGGYQSLAQGLPVFGSYLCTGNQAPTLASTISADLQAVIKTFYYTSDPGGPPCVAQPALGGLTTGQQQAFPHLTPLP
jgi:hypothetical protein